MNIKSVLKLSKAQHQLREGSTNESFLCDRAVAFGKAIREIHYIQRNIYRQNVYYIHTYIHTYIQRFLRPAP